MKKISINYAIFLLLINTTVLAQLLSGPISPCVNCEQLTAKTEPFNGTWFNPDQSGTGFSIDVQNGKLFGVYYGYDEQGKVIWLTFVGDLVASEQTNVMWTLDAELLQFKNGNAFNQDYTAPETTEYQGQIHLKFTQKNHALFSVNDGEEQNIVPIIFGVQKTVDFPEKTSYQFPELTGLWTFVNYFRDLNLSVKYSTASEVLYIWPKEEFIIDSDNDGYLDIEYEVWRYAGEYPGALGIGKILCSLIDNDLGQTVGPQCRFVDRRFATDPFNPPTYNMSLGGLGAFRLFGESLDLGTFEAIRIDTIDHSSNPVNK